MTATLGEQLHHKNCFSAEFNLRPMIQFSRKVCGEFSCGFINTVIIEKNWDMFVKIVIQLVLFRL